MKYSYSTDEEKYHGEFDRENEAIQEGAEMAGVGGAFWIGENTPPEPPENRFDAADWLEEVSCRDDYSGEWAEDWDRSTKEQRTELEDQVRAVMSLWLDRHELRPTFFNIGKTRCFHVTGDTGEAYTVEEIKP